MGIHFPALVRQNFRYGRMPARGPEAIFLCTPVISAERCIVHSKEKFYLYFDIK